MKTLLVKITCKIFLGAVILVLPLSCGEIIGFDDFSQPDIGAAGKIEIFFTESNLVKFYNTVSSPEENDVPCRVIIGKKSYNGSAKVRGFTSRVKVRKNITIKYIDNKTEKEYALMTEADTWFKNRIVMYAYKNYKGYTDAVFASEGLAAAPETKAAALFINDKYIGYYAKVDIYGKANLEKIYNPRKENFRNKKISELFKVHLGSYNEYPLFSRSEKKFPDNNDFSSLEILINNVTSLNDSVWENWVRENIDIPDFVRYMVIHDYFGVTDTEIQNFYIYNYGKMSILPWDNELGMDIAWNGFYGHNKLTEKILEIPDIRNLYRQELNNFKNNSVFNTELKAKINEFFAEAKDAVKNTPDFYDFSDFERVKNDIIDFLDNRKNYISL